MKYYTEAKKGVKYIDYRTLEPVQGNLKNLTESNYKKLLKSVQDHGFFVPVFVWQDGGHNYLLDGHGRLRVLKKETIEFENTGFDIPVYYIKADNLDQAKKKLLKITSQYQTITQEGYDAFTAELPEAELMDVNFDALQFGSQEETEEDEPPEVSSEPPISKLGEVYQFIS